MQTGVELVFNGAHGIYIPQLFARAIQDSEGWKGIDPDDVSILLSGPDADYYWDAWDNVMRDAHYIHEPSAPVWYLWQDGDLFMLCDELMTDEEREAFQCSAL